MTSAIVPLFDLRLRTARLELRVPSGAEMAELAARAPQDLETDPAWSVPAELGPPVAVAVLQSYWRALGTWRTDRWRLPFAVSADGELVGIQELEAERLSVLRTVETSSWLVPQARGRGIGREMRAAVLALAFDHLGAEVAASGAWETNAASLGVSRALGYEDNGWRRHEHEGRVAVMRLVVLPRQRWDASRYPTAVEHLDRCRAWFGPPGDG